MNFDKVKIGARIKKTISKSGLTQKAIAEALNLTPNAITNYSQAKTTPSIEMIYKIAKLCKTNPSWIITGEGEFSSKKAIQKLKEQALMEEKIEKLFAENNQLKYEILDAKSQYSLLMSKLISFYKSNENYIKWLESGSHKKCIDKIQQINWNLVTIWDNDTEV